MAFQKTTIKGAALPNIPWEDAPAGYTEPVWRYSKNPIIDRRHIPEADRIFNSAVIPKDGNFHGVFRVDGRNGIPFMHHGVSHDGLNWKIERKPIAICGEDGKPMSFVYQYDPRVVRIGRDFLITWCNGNVGPTIGIARTRDFKTYQWVSNAFLPFNRNGVLFPKKFGRDYYMLSRPSDNGHTPFGDVYLSKSRDLIDWGRHQMVLKAKINWGESVKNGAGPAPIETSEGWLLFYHRVIGTCNGFLYSMGAALLDLEDPSKVLLRGNGYLLSPETDYECMGMTPNVVFPCAALTDSASGRIAIYYGAADTYTALCFTTVDIVMDWLRRNNCAG